MKSLDIRGTNGSGKSHIIHTLLGKYPNMKLFPSHYGGSKPWGYYIDKFNLYVIGPYENVAGGCDQVPTINEVVRRVDEALLAHNVIFEGLLVSGSFTRWNEWAIGKDHTIGYLDTPYKECVRRVVARRHARGDFRPFNDKHLANKYRMVRSTRRKFITAGRTVVDIPWKMAFETVEQLCK